MPLIANGDCNTADDARMMMRVSGADGVMIGRGAYGRPWWPGVIANFLEPGSGIEEPSLEEEGRIVAQHLVLTLETYGDKLGNKTARKHLGWTLLRLVERRLLDEEQATRWRQRLLTNADNEAVAEDVRQLYAELTQRKEAA